MTQTLTDQYRDAMCEGYWKRWNDEVQTRIDKVLDVSL